HELLGKALADALIDLPYSVSTEEELALRSQRLDVLIIEQAVASTANLPPVARSQPTPSQIAYSQGIHSEVALSQPTPSQGARSPVAPSRIAYSSDDATLTLTDDPTDQRPDGLDDLVAHNLLSYKASGQAYDAWALDELNSHYVTYRKLASIRTQRHLPTGDTRPITEPRTGYPLLPASRPLAVVLQRYRPATRRTYPIPPAQQSWPPPAQHDGPPLFWRRQDGPDHRRHETRSPRMADQAISQRARSRGAAQGA
ncbi:MAG: hypothetical protein C1943_13660, partial [Halochromatium sp.]|nr:hypothetical protein [Halochromatium sp.]